MDSVVEDAVRAAAALSSDHASHSLETLRPNSPPRSSLERLAVRQAEVLKAPTITAGPNNGSNTTVPSIVLNQESPVLDPQVLQRIPTKASSTIVTTTPDPEQYASKFKGARTAVLAGDLPTALELCYQLIEPDVPQSIRAKAALIIVTFDSMPGDSVAYGVASSLVDAVGKMKQEEIDPELIDLWRSMGKKEIFGDGFRPLKESHQPGGAPKMAGVGLSDVVDREQGMALRRKDRQQLDGGVVTPEDKGEDDDGKQDGQTEGRVTPGEQKSSRNCCIIN